MIAASVCSASITAVLSEPPVVGRCSALTMPSVTVPSRPSGDPTATTVWPILTASESANVAAVSPDAEILTTARSVTVSVPTMVAGTVRPSASVAVMLPPFAATATTCWLVRM